MLICQRHYCAKPCNDCALDAFVAAFARATHAQSAQWRAPTDTIASPAVITFKPLIFEHMFHPWETPRAFDSPRELRKEAEARGVTPHYLRDSTLWRSRDPRW